MAAQGRAAGCRAGVTPTNTDYFQLSVPKNTVHPNLAKLFVSFMATKEAQGVLQKHESRSSHLVEGTLMQKYLKEIKSPSKSQSSRSIIISNPKTPKVSSSKRNSQNSERIIDLERLEL